METVVSVSPFTCRMWALHQRLEHHVNEETCRTEIESIVRHGQLIPVLGRRLSGDPEHEIELIYGARRLFVTRHLNKPLRVELRDISDREAIVAMDIENRHRVDISPYERGLSYAQWMRASYFKTQDDLAHTLRVSPSQVSRLLKLARLPSVIVGAFLNPHEICEGWGIELFDAWEDPERRNALTRKARVIGAMTRRPPSKEVYEQLMAAAAQTRRRSSACHDEVIKDANGLPLFRIRYQRESVALVLPIQKIPAHSLDNIRRAVVDILQNARPQALDLKRLSHTNLTSMQQPSA